MVEVQRVILMLGGTAAFILPFMFNIKDNVVAFFAGFIGGALGAYLWKLAIKMRRNENQD